MSVTQHVASDRQLARLLQIGIVLEEVVEARAYHHYHALFDDEADRDPAIAALLEHARTESAEHRDRLEALIEELDADTVPYEEIEALVNETYGRTRPEDFDGVLYDQLAGEETAYKFYDDLIAAIENSEATFSIDTDHLIRTLADIRNEEAEGVEEVTELMQRR